MEIDNEKRITNAQYRFGNMVAEVLRNNIYVRFNICASHENPGLKSAILQSPKTFSGKRN